MSSNFQLAITYPEPELEPKPEPEPVVVNVEDDLVEKILNMSPEEIEARTRLLDNEVRIMRSETGIIQHELNSMEEKIKEDAAKIKVHKKLPYLVANVVEVSYR